MERKITNELIKWKNNSLKKPILLYGISGCGKTYTVLEFGKKEYKNTIYFDCFNNLELNYVFKKNTTMEKLIRGLAAISLETIFPEDSLIIFDNVDEKILMTIKKLFNGISSYHIIMITDSEDVLAKNKGDQVFVKKMSLIGFDEYLRFIGKEQLVTFIEDSFKNDKNMPFHSIALEAFNDFVITGGYPETIISFEQEKDYNLLSMYHTKNIKLLKYRLINLDNLIDIKRGNEILDNISYQILKDNKKFQYGLLKNGARAKEYEKSISFMEKNNIVIKCYKVSKIETPLSKIKDEDSFKLYYNDTGILYKKMNININRLLTNDKLLEIIYENSIVNALSANNFNLYYYHSEGKSEIDFVIQTRTGKILPMEIIYGDNNNKSKSLVLTMAKYNIPLAIRFTNDNFSSKKNIKYVPFYAAFCITENM